MTIIELCNALGLEPGPPRPSESHDAHLEIELKDGDATVFYGTRADCRVFLYGAAWQMNKFLKVMS